MNQCEARGCQEQAQFWMSVDGHIRGVCSHHRLHVAIPHLPSPDFGDELEEDSGGTSARKPKVVKPSEEDLAEVPPAPPVPAVPDEPVGH